MPMKKNTPSPQTNATSDDSAIATAPKRVTVATIDDDALFVAVQEIPEEELEDVHVRELPPEPRLRRAWCYRGGTWMRRAALIGSDGRYLRIDEVPPDKLSSLHLPQIVDCDLDPSLGYRWQPDAKNALGGSFVPPPRKSPEQKFNESEPLPALALFYIRIWKLKVLELPEQTLAWLKWYVRTVDFKSYLEAIPEAQEFKRATDNEENK